ncbi:XRE family transcriptional regulator [Ruminococcus sp. AM40-10AC]|nr:XRE family transcriptional regulator [Ruminococcus sp. AM40-10AC]
MIADKIKNARTIKQLTQGRVAEDLNVSRQTISNWENGVSHS